MDWCLAGYDPPEPAGATCRYRGSERHAAAAKAAGLPEKVLAGIAEVGGLVPAVVTSVDESSAVAWACDVGPVDIAFESME